MDELQYKRNMVIEKGIPCELIGNWLWITDFGDNYDWLVANGFNYSNSKCALYYTNKPYVKKTEKIYSIDELREIYNKNVLIRG